MNGPIYVVPPRRCLPSPDPNGELSRLKAFLDECYWDEVGAGDPKGETAVQAAIRLLKRHVPIHNQYGPEWPDAME